MVTGSPEQFRLWRGALGELGVEMDASRSATEAAEKLARGKYEAVAVDHDTVGGSAGLLMAVRSAPTSHHAVLFVISTARTRPANLAGFGVNFFLTKPVTPEWLGRCLRAAHGAMMADQRRYFRQSVDIPVTIEAGGSQLRGRITNLSEGGMGVTVSGLEGVRQKVRVSFMLPGGERPLEARAAVAWADENGRAGLIFQDLLPSQRAALMEWLSARFAEAWSQELAVL